MNELQEFYDRVERHDWFSAMSDDHGVWQRGESNWSKLNAEAAKDPKKKEILDGFSKHHYSGEPWKTEKAPKPVRPETERDV